jgi:hypothetical protein
VYLEGEFSEDDIYEGARVYRFGVVPGRFIDNLIICVSLRASSLKIDGGAIKSHMVSRAQLGAEGGL